MFWAIIMSQLPYIAHFFGGTKVFFWLPFVYGMASNFARLSLMLLHSVDKRATGSKLSQLVTWGASGTTIGLVAFPVSMVIVGDSNPNIGFAVCLILSSVVGTFNSLSVTGGFALMSLVPKGMGQFYLLGLTVTGIVTWPFMIGVRAIASAAGGGSSTGLIVAIISLGMAAILCFASIPVYLRYTSKNPLLRAQLEGDSSVLETTKAGLTSTFRQVWVPVTALWVARVSTFALYPGMIGLWSPQSSDSYTKDFYQSFLIYLGPLSDTIGQVVYRFTPWFQRLGVGALVVITAVRAAIILPLFILSAKLDGTDSVVSSDWFRMGLMFFFSFSMGINYSLGNAVVPQAVNSTEERFTAGVILSFVATNGLFIGSLVGIGLKEFV
jgi:hypothetical protein